MTLRDLQGIASQIAPGAVIRDPGASHTARILSRMGVSLVAVGDHGLGLWDDHVPLPDDRHDRR